MSQRIPAAFIQEMLARNDIVEIIRSRVHLTKRGDNYQARCPFHEEKTPSFSVSQSKQFYYCFGCSAHGNVIGFLMAYDHMEFREAVGYLAGLLGLDIPQEAGAESSHQYQNLYVVLEKAARIFQLKLRNNETAIQYLKSRGISGATAKNFGIGYNDQGGLVVQFKSESEQQALIDNGLIIKKDSNQYYERFRQRIIFPIRNVQGKVIGFGGRTIHNAQPKYLNSPETPIFHKGSELYGLYEVRQYKEPFDKLVVVEGYMDVVALHQHGIHDAVATMGTAVTTQQIQKLLRYTDQLIFCFDGDRAGRSAAWKALLLSLPLLRDRIRVNFLFLPEKEDPDSLIRNIGGAAFAEQIAKATPLADFFFNELKAKNPIRSAADKAHFGQQAAQYLNTIPQGLFRQLLYDQLAEQLHISVETLSEHLQPAPLKPAATRVKVTAKTRLLPPALLATALLLQQADLADLMTDIHWLEVIDAPGIELLLKILRLIKEKPTLSTGEILSICEDDNERQMIAMLAARPFSISAEGMKAELIGILNQLQQQTSQQEINRLIEKSKKMELNLTEKLKLQTLLANIKKEAVQR